MSQISQSYCLRVLNEFCALNHSFSIQSFIKYYQIQKIRVYKFQRKKSPLQCAVLEAK